MRYVLLGDAESPHLLKWARALAPKVDLWAASSRGFHQGFDGLLAVDRRLALGTRPRVEGGNFGLLRELPRLASWLKQVQPEWIHAHYLTSHGTLAWLATRFLGAPGRLLGSAWGSDILVTPQRSAFWRALTRRVLRACALSTSDSRVMAERMRALGAAEVLTFPFGLERMPALPDPQAKQPRLLFANRGLEAIYDPLRVLRLFECLSHDWPDARLVIANEGSMRGLLERQLVQRGLADRVQFIGKVDAESQALWYQRARWYVSLPRSDSVSVSVLEAMAHGCIPILSDLPANREVVDHGENGWIVPLDELPTSKDLQALLFRADDVARANHAWVASHALFEPSVEAFLMRLRALSTA